MNITEKIVEHCENIKFSVLPRDVVEYCKVLILDFIGIPVKSSDLESSKSLYSGISSISKGGECTAIPHGSHFLPQYAALINGVYGHSLDYDDTHRESSIHPGVSVIPSLLAAGEVFGADGKRLIESMVAGYDVACKLGMAVNPAEHYSHGFHGTGTCGVFGATAAAGIIADLNPSELLNAFGINISQVAGSMQFLENGSWNKRLHPGFAAHNAILAVNLAKSGFIGAAKPIEGKYGFLNSYTHNPDPEKAILGLGERYEVVFTGVKPYPCCRYIHPAVDIVLQLLREGTINGEEIERIDVEMVRPGYYIVGYPIERKQKPQNVVDAQFSMPFALAVAILKGKLTVDEFNNKNLNDAEVKKMMKKIHVKHSEELDKDYPQKWPVVVTIKTKYDKLVVRKDYPKGEHEDPVSFEEVAEKFKSLVNHKLGEDRANEVLKIVRRLEKLNDIRELTELLIEEK